MTRFPVDKRLIRHQRPATLVGISVIVIIALLWAAGEAMILPIWPAGRGFLGITGWVVALFLGCRAAVRCSPGARFPLAAERVAVTGFFLALAGSVAARLAQGTTETSWSSLVLRFLIGLMVVSLAVRSRKKGRRADFGAYSQRAHHFGKTLLEERE